MADTKTTALSAFASLASGDLLVGVEDPGGTPVTKKLTVDALDTYLSATTGTLTNKTINTASNTITIVEADISDLGSYIESVEGTAVLSTGEVGGTKFLREDGDGTCSWQTIAGGGDALTANPLSQFASTTSAQLAGVISNETGSGSLVFGTSPTIATAALTTPTVSSDLILAEAADHASTPGAGYGYLWVKNDAPNNLYFTDDAGTDYQLNGTEVTGTSGQIYVFNGSNSLASVAMSGGATISNAGVVTISNFADGELVLDGSTSGTVTVNAPATAGTTTVVLPSASGTLATLAGTETLTNKTIGAATLSGTLSVADNNINRAVLDDYGVSYSAANITGAATYDISTSGNVCKLTMTGNVTSMAFNNPTGTGDACTLTVYLAQDATGSRTMTWPASVDWPSGTAPTITATASAVDCYVFQTFDGGTTWYGNTVGQAYA